MDPLIYDPDGHTGMSKPIALHAGVSTNEQTTEHQRHQLHHYAASRGVESVTIADEGVNGAKDSRPALNQLPAAVSRREVSAVVLAPSSLDRRGASGSCSRWLRRWRRYPFRCVPDIRMLRVPTELRGGVID